MSTKFDLCQHNLAKTKAKANFYKAELDKASLVGTIFAEIEGMRTSFSRTNLQFANFTRANLLKAGFVATNLNEANLTGANLRRASFLKTDLRYAVLRDANLDAAFFEGTRLFGADFTNAKNLETIQIEWIDIGKNAQRIK